MGHIGICLLVLASLRALVASAQLIDKPEVYEGEKVRITCSLQNVGLDLKGIKDLIYAVDSFTIYKNKKTLIAWGRMDDYTVDFDRDPAQELDQRTTVVESGLQEKNQVIDKNKGSLSVVIDRVNCTDSALYTCTVAYKCYKYNSDGKCVPAEKYENSEKKTLISSSQRLLVKVPVGSISPGMYPDIEYYNDGDKLSFWCFADTPKHAEVEWSKARCTPSGAVISYAPLDEEQIYTQATPEGCQNKVFTESRAINIQLSKDDCLVRCVIAARHVDSEKRNSGSQGPEVRSFVFHVFNSGEPSLVIYERVKNGGVRIRNSVSIIFLNLLLWFGARWLHI